MDYFAPPSYLMGLSDGTAGTRETLQLMSALVQSGKTSPVVRQLAVSLVKGLPSRDWIGYAQAIQTFVQDHIQYVPDVSDVETLQTPERTLANGSGDCDDQSVLLASLLEAIGQPTRFVAVAFTLNEFSHVYTQVQPGGSGPWLGAETIIKRPLGWEPVGVVDMLIIRN